MKTRVNTVTGEVLTIGHGASQNDGPDIITYEGEIPVYVRTVDLFYNGSEIINDPDNANAVAHDNAVQNRRDIKARLRDDRDNRGRDGMPQLANSINDVLQLLNLEE